MAYPVSRTRQVGDCSLTTASGSPSTPTLSDMAHTTTITSSTYTTTAHPCVQELFRFLYTLPAHIIKNPQFCLTTSVTPIPFTLAALGLLHRAAHELYPLFWDESRRSDTARQVQDVLDSGARLIIPTTWPGIDGVLSELAMRDAAKRPPLKRKADEATGAGSKAASRDSEPQAKVQRVTRASVRNQTHAPTESSAEGTSSSSSSTSPSSPPVPHTKPAVIQSAPIAANIISKRRRSPPPAVPANPQRVSARQKEQRQPRAGELEGISNDAPSASCSAAPCMLGERGRSISRESTGSSRSNDTLVASREGSVETVVDADPGVTPDEPMENAVLGKTSQKAVIIISGDGNVASVGLEPGMVTRSRRNREPAVKSQVSPAVARPKPSGKRKTAKVRPRD